MFGRKENSTEDGNSVELYYFQCGTKKWTFSGGERDITWHGKVYEAMAIHNNGITQSGDATDDNCEIMLPTDNELVSMLVLDRPSVEVKVIIRRKHYGDNDAPIHWIGTLASYGRTENAKEYKLTCQVMTASFNRNSARMTWSRQCQAALYDHNCTVDPKDFDTNVHIDALDNDEIKSNDLAGIGHDYFANGYIEWTNEFSLTQRRSIENNGAKKMTIIGGTRGLAIGMTIKAYPGCNRNTLHCDHKFDNLSNFRGFEQIPGKSPFQGNPIW